MTVHSTQAITEQAYIEQPESAGIGVNSDVLQWSSSMKANLEIWALYIVTPFRY